MCSGKENQSIVYIFLKELNGSSRIGCASKQNVNEERTHELENIPIEINNLKKKKT